MNGHLVCLNIAICQMIWTGGSEGKPGPEPGLFSCDTLAAIVKPWCMVKDAIQLSVHPSVSSAHANIYRTIELDNS